MSIIHGTGNLDRSNRPAPRVTRTDSTRRPEARARAIDYRAARAHKYGGQS